MDTRIRNNAGTWSVRATALLLTVLVGGCGGGGSRKRPERSGKRTTPAIKSVRPAAESTYKEWPFDEPEAKRRQKETAETLGVAVEEAVDLGDGVKLELVLIPAGRFVMGSPASEAGRTSDEGPQHEVTITKAFYMGKYEIAQEQYEKIIGRNPGSRVGARIPVDNVSRDECEDFCREAAKEIGANMRLATEAEWEYACRAGTVGRFSTGDTDEDLAKACQLSPTGEPRVLEGSNPVGQKAPNAWGLYDMHGNVWEWCQDFFDPYRVEAATDPVCSLPHAHQFGGVFRGGGTEGGFPETCRSAMRAWTSVPCGGRAKLGFRVVVELPRTP